MLGLKLRFQPVFVGFELRGRATEFVAPGDATPRLHGPGFCHVRGVHQQARRHLERVKAGVRLLHHFPGNFQRRVTDVNAVAGFQVQQGHQAWGQQNRARCRFEARRIGLQIAVHRIDVINSFDARQLRRVCGESHGLKAELLTDFQPLFTRRVDPRLRHIARTAERAVARHELAALLA
ncbi:hypothetical protein D3C71_954560 [compost metagenome]